MISVLTFALVAFCSLLLLLKNRKHSLCQSETVFFPYLPLIYMSSLFVQCAPGFTQTVAVCFFFS